MTHCTIEIVEFKDEILKPLIRVWAGRHPEIYNNTFNYARFFLPSIFPQVDAAIYLDADTIVQSDLQRLLNLFSSRKRSDSILMAVVGKTSGKRSLCSVLKCEDPLIDSLVSNKEEPYFNAGVLVTSLNEWRRRDVTGRAMQLLTVNSQRKLWRWGSQGPLCLVFSGEWEELPPSWNERGARLWTSEMRADLSRHVNVTYICIFTCILLI